MHVLGFRFGAMTHAVQAETILVRTPKNHVVMIWLNTVYRRIRDARYRRHPDHAYLAAVQAEKSNAIEEVLEKAKGYINQGNINQALPLLNALDALRHMHILVKADYFLPERPGHLSAIEYLEDLARKNGDVQQLALSLKIGEYRAIVHEPSSAYVPHHDDLPFDSKRLDGLIQDLDNTLTGAYQKAGIPQFIQAVKESTQRPLKNQYAYQQLEKWLKLLGRDAVIALARLDVEAPTPLQHDTIISLLGASGDPFAGTVLIHKFKELPRYAVNARAMEIDEASVAGADLFKVLPIFSALSQIRSQEAYTFFEKILISPYLLDQRIFDEALEGLTNQENQIGALTILIRLANDEKLQPASRKDAYICAFKLINQESFDSQGNLQMTRDFVDVAHKMIGLWPIFMPKTSVWLWKRNFDDSRDRLLEQLRQKNILSMYQSVKVEIKDRDDVSLLYEMIKTLDPEFVRSAAESFDDGTDLSVNDWRMAAGITHLRFHRKIPGRIAIQLTNGLFKLLDPTQLNSAWLLRTFVYDVIVDKCGELLKEINALTVLHATDLGKSWEHIVDSFMRDFTNGRYYRGITFQPVAGRPHTYKILRTNA